MFDWIYLSLFQYDTLHFAVEVAEDSPSASGYTGAKEHCTLPQVFLTPQTKLLRSQESRILANPVFVVTTKTITSQQILL